MFISKKAISASIAALFVAVVVVQSFGIVQAQPKGYVQADCPNIVKQAIDTVSAQCGKTARGKLCYGKSNITAQFKPGANNVQFSTPGDTVDVSAIKQLALGGMDTTNNQWGVAEMKIQADLPDGDPSQVVTMIMFGNVQLSDASIEANTAVLNATPGASGRQSAQATATTNAVNQQATHMAATATKIAGLEGTATTRALTPTPTGTISNVKATQGAATATKLAAYENTATAAPILQMPVPSIVTGPYKDLQAFNFQSSDTAPCDTAPCDTAPHDGILIQVPENLKSPVKLRIDDAVVYLNSTIFVTAQANKFLTISSLQGSVTVVQAETSNFETLLPGTYTKLPIDANLHVSGAPTPLAFYTADMIRFLPTRILPNASVAFVPGLPANIKFDNWTIVLTVAYGPCVPTTSSSVIALAYNDLTMWFSLNSTELVLFKSDKGAYATTLVVPTTNRNGVVTGYSNVLTMALSIDSPKHISGDFTPIISGVICVYNIDLTRTS